MNVPDLDNCPPLEDIAAFIDGTINHKKRELLIEHIDKCSLCYETLTGTLDSQKEFPNFLEEDKSADVLEFKPTKKQLLIQKLRNSKNNLLYIAAAATIAGIIGFNTLSPDTHDLLESPNAFNVVQSLNIIE